MRTLCIIMDRFVIFQTYTADFDMAHIRYKCQINVFYRLIKFLNVKSYVNAKSVLFYPDQLAFVIFYN